MTVTNRYYNSSAAAVIGSSVKSAAYNDQFLLVQRGFDLIQDAINALLSESAIQPVFPGSLIIKVIPDTTYTMVASDAGALLIFTAVTAVTVTVPSGIFEQGAVSCLRQGNAGKVTLSAGLGVTFASSDNTLSTRTQSAQIAIVSDDGIGMYGVIGERDFGNLGFAILTGPNAFTGVQSVPFVTLTDNPTVTVNAALSNNFRVTLGGNRTLANPTNLVDGCILNFRIKQDGTGSRTLAYGTKYKFPGGTLPVLSTAAGAKDLLVAIYEPGDDILLCNMLKAFA